MNSAQGTHLLASDGSDGTRGGHLTGTECLGGDFSSLGEKGLLSGVVSDLREMHQRLKVSQEESAATHFRGLDLQDRNTGVISGSIVYSVSQISKPSLGGSAVVLCDLGSIRRRDGVTGDRDPVSTDGFEEGDVDVLVLLHLVVLVGCVVVDVDELELVGAGRVHGSGVL